MNPLLADLATLPAETLKTAFTIIWMMIGGVAVIGGIVLGWLNFAASRKRDARTDKPQTRDLGGQPIAVTSVEPFATRRELDGVRTDVAEIRANFLAIMKDSEKRSVDLHNRINPLVENTAEIKGKMEGFTAAIEAFRCIARTCGEAQSRLPRD